MAQERLFTIDCTICDTSEDKKLLYKFCSYLPSDVFDDLYNDVGMCFCEVEAETPEQALDKALYNLSELIEEDFPDLELDSIRRFILYNREEFKVYISDYLIDEHFYILRLTDFKVYSLKRW